MKKQKLLMLFAIIILLIMTVSLLSETQQEINTDLNVNIVSDKVTLENSATNIYVGDEGIDDETADLLKSYGIDFYYGKSGIDTSKYDIVIYNDKKNTDFEMKDNTLIINSLYYDEYPLMYSFSIKKTINDVMVTPYIEDNNEYIKVNELAIKDNDYKKQTQIANDIGQNISNLNYIAKEEYNYITDVTEINDLAIVNKNSCMVNEQNDFSTPNVRLSNYTTSEVHTISSAISDDVKLLFDDLSSQGIDIVFDSGYRSKNIQESLYNSYVSSDGIIQADKYSARPGCSEHQTGYAFDINTVENEFGELENLNNTDTAKKIQDTAYKYGFILRYPENKTHITQYMYESWHFRYVGTEASKIIYDNNITLEEYVNNKEYYDSII